MKDLQEFERYMAHLGDGLGHADRQGGLRGYCTGLMAPLKRKSVEPMAAHLAPSATRSRHQSLHHFVADSAWSDEQMLVRIAQWVVPAMDFSDGGWWIVDDTGFPKQGQHSVGVAQQYCGMLGKQDYCQVAVSVTLACQAGSLPVAWQLYLPKEWTEDMPRREKASVPQDLEFATKPAIALAQIERLMEQCAPRHCVLADAAYGVETAFRERLSELGLPYAVGVTGQVTEWPPGHEPLPPEPYPPSRSTQAARTLYEGLRPGGVLMSDGYERYAAIAEQHRLVHLGCWAHCRRYFYEALQQERTQHSKPVLERIEAQALQHLHGVLPGSLLGKALHHLTAQWPKLVRYVDDGRYPIDYNACENAIRPSVVGRRRWLFADTVAGANASAILYSLLQTCLANGIDGYRYFRALLVELPKAGTLAHPCKAVFTRLFRELGLGLRIRTDNGVPFAGTSALCRLSQLSVWWLKLGILLELIQPGQPQQNGRHERMHRTLKAEQRGLPKACPACEQ